jgi:hypothetical protein
LSKETFVNLKLVVAISVLTEMPAFGQTDRLPTKPTTADVQRVVETISGDKTMMQTYCDLSKLNQQMAKLDEKTTEKTIERLVQKTDDLEQKLGPDYAKLMDELDQLDHKSSDANGFGAAFGALDKQCK